ncbi:Chromosome partition protein smc [Minicystis rosea]|nr:Chromosome partition protein smc [Minicystis rosea]
MSSSAAIGSTASPSAGLLRALKRRWPLGLIAVAAAGFAAPVALLAHGTERARACVASYEAPRGPALPDCKREIRWFFTPSRIPWTATPARYRAEEIAMRAAVAGYHDAVVGRAEAAAIAPAVDALMAAEKVVQGGSQRVALEDLGAAVGAPDAGRSAMLLGDRRTLLDRYEMWPHWTVRFRALEAALLEGDAARAGVIARRYAEFDPRDEDLRTAVAAVLCLDGGGKRGLELLVTVQGERAMHRHESWARNWGEVRATIVACAAKAGLPTPPAPERWEAGSGDLLEVRTALRLRLLGRGGDPTVVRDTAANVIQTLKKGALPAHARIHLLAALFATGHGLDAAVAASIAAPHTDDGELPLRAPARDLTAVEWLGESRGLHPTATAEALRDGAAKLRRLASTADLSEGDRRVLVDAAAAAAVEGARTLAAAGDAVAAVAILDQTEATLSDGERALARSSAFYTAGDAARALAEIERDPPEPKSALGAAWLLQRAEILASLGRREDAARAVVAADEAAMGAGDRALDVRAQWTRLALARSRRSSLAVPAGERAWPWVGPMAAPTAWLDPAAESADTLARALAFWDGARRASSEDRRALRYAAVSRHAGELPRALPPYLLVAGELLTPAEGDVEIWLDAFSATASRSMTMRAYAWSRAEAARFRGDAASAARWSERLRGLRKLSAPPENAELAAVLGI